MQNHQKRYISSLNKRIESTNGCILRVSGKEEYLVKSAQMRQIWENKKEHGNFWTDRYAKFWKFGISSPQIPNPSEINLYTHVAELVDAPG